MQQDGPLRHKKELFLFSTTHHEGEGDSTKKEERRRGRMKDKRRKFSLSQDLPYIMDARQ